MTVAQKKYLLLFVAFICAISARYVLFPHRTGDINGFVQPWFLKLQSDSFLSVFEKKFYNYNPAYLYLLWAAGKVGLGPILSIKILSLLFEIGCILLASRICAIFNPGVSSLCFATLLFCPTLILNASMWGQADSIYAFFVLSSVFFVLKDKFSTALLCLGIGFSFKAQAAFALPAFFILWILEILRLRTLIKGALLFCVIYFVLLIPTLIAGRSLASLLSIYIDQFNTYHSLSNNAANIWLWFKKEGYKFYKIAGILITLGLIMLFAMFSLGYRAIDRNKAKLLAFTLSLLAIPFFLPKMHDRYFYCAEILSVVVAFVVPRSWWIALFINFASWAAYANWTYGIRPFDFKLIPFLNIAALIGLLQLWFKNLEPAQVKDRIVE